MDPGQSIVLDHLSKILPGEGSANILRVAARCAFTFFDITYLEKRRESDSTRCRGAYDVTSGGGNRQLDL